MAPREFDALVRASRWTALTPYLAIDGSNGVRVAAEFDDAARAVLGLAVPVRLRTIADARRMYLGWHRDHRFRPRERHG